MVDLDRTAYGRGEVSYLAWSQLRTESAMTISHSTSLVDIRMSSVICTFSPPFQSCDARTSSCTPPVCGQVGRATCRSQGTLPWWSSSNVGPTTILSLHSPPHRKTRVSTGRCMAEVSEGMLPRHARPRVVGPTDGLGAGGPLTLAASTSHCGFALSWPPNCERGGHSTGEREWK